MTVAGLRQRWRLQRQALAARRDAIEEIHSNADFQVGLTALAAQLGRDVSQVSVEAQGYLDEMVTVHSEAFPDFNLLLSRLADRRGYEGVIQYDGAAVERLRELNESSPLVMLTGHRSYTDFVVRVPFAWQDFDREYRFAGANIAFWPVGTIGHTAGIIFIRRGFRDPVYAFVLRRYVGWLTERRSNFLWAIEGGRTRTGKLLAPKAGLLAYVADAFVDDRGPDVLLVPGTVVYDQLSEVFEYARYGRGESKSGESVLAFLPFVRKLRRVPEEAAIAVGIGEPVALGDFLGRDERDPEALAQGIRSALQAVSRRIDAATPITAVALVLLPLLEHDGAERTIDGIVTDLAPIIEHVDRRGLPTSTPGARDADGVRRAIALLGAQGLVTTDGSGDQTRYRVMPGRHLEASYYRNAIVHYFAVRAIAEIALVRTRAADDGGRVEVFWQRVDRLRDLLDREFFFAEGTSFTREVRDELDAALPAWEARLEEPDGLQQVLDALRPFAAPCTLAPFLEAYALVAGSLRRRGSLAIIDEGHLLADSLAHGQFELTMGRLRRPDAVSLNMFQTPLATARAAGLLAGGEFDGRCQFGDEIEAGLAAVAELEAQTACEVVSSPV